MLDDVELQQVQKIESEDEAVVQRHSVPALEGDFLQDLGRRSTRVDLTGVLTGPEAAKGLQKLRDKFRKTEPISFVADIATATVVDKVLIEQMEVEELAGKPERFAYALSVLEFVPPPKPETEPPPPPPPPPTKVDTGTLVVEVIVTGQPGFDFSTVTVTVKGNKDDGSDFSRTLTSRKDNVWTDEAMPLGSFTAKAEMITPPVMSGTAAAKIQAGQTTKVTITLTPGGVVATEFVVHFRFDKAFVEPCMRQVLTQVMQFASDHKDQKLLIVGHTDLVGTPPGAITGPDPYNQSLSERRARAVYAYLTFGRDQATTDTSVTEWNALRQKQSGGKNKPTLADNWGTREYQHMLQDLGFYPGAVDGQEGKLTQEAVRAFRCHSGLPPGTTMDDPAWDKLIRAYMAQDNFALADDRFLRNCGTESLKWIGCASQDPVKNVPVAHRPNRRVELLFTTDSKLPCEVPQPDTFDLLPPGDTVGSGWCVGPGDKSKRACFVVPHEPKDGKPKDKEWTRTLAEPGSITVEVSIKQEVKKDDGTIERKPVSAEKFVVITSDGQFLKGEQSRGEPDPDTTTDGKKTYSDKQPGIYSLEVVPKPGKPSVMVQLEGEPGADAKGNVVCKHLTDKDNTLNVVILLDRVLRQVRLPAAAHLMRALNPVTHTVRTCPVFGKPGSTFEQKTVRDEAAVRAAFTAANEIWRQARIRFDLSNVVQEAYSFSVACEVTNSEFTILLERCAYPQVMNVFFVADLEGNAEAGVGVSIENGAAAGITGGCAVGDRFQFTIIGIPTDKLLDPQQTAQVLAHELGHVLNLDHTSDDSSNEKRLMFPATGLAGDNTLLVTDKTVDEIGTARASQGAGFECVPLTLTVKGAIQVGGSLSHEFILIQDPAKTVTVDAQISDELLAEGTVTMTGGNAGANDRQRTVSGAAAGAPVEIVATYTPNSGGNVVTARRVVLVATFQLRVEGDGVKQVDATTFTVLSDPVKVVTVIADIAPAPFCIPNNLIEWKKGDEVSDPQRRSVSRTKAAEVTVSATVAGVTRSVTVRVIQLEVVASASAAVPPLTSLRVGLWDHAFDSATGNLLNGLADAANFVGADSRRFFFRVNDPKAASKIQLNWRTAFANNSNDDAPPSQVITLTESGAGTSVFLSKAVMLVTDDVDTSQATNSGLPAGDPDAGDRNRGQSNHRTRKTTVDDTHQLDGKVVFEYTPSAPGISLAASVPVFARTPEERRRARVHFINVRKSVGGGGILPVARRDLVKRTFQSIYAVCGIFADMDEILVDPPASCTGWAARFPGDLHAVDPSVEGVSVAGGRIAPSPSMTDLINVVRALPSFKANDIYLISVAFIFDSPLPAPPGPLATRVGGQSFADSFTVPGSVAVGFAFIAVNSGITEYVEVHEATHITTDLPGNIAGGHFDLGAAGAAAPGNIDGRNLMNRFVLGNALGVRNPKRLWNDVFRNTNQVPNLLIPPQVDAIRRSRFVGNF
jgi:outer membrane protein OmpA-like peptidoglycan-associated protein/peptidoglycan hydrolase-like protein with peptidoglycan-binding domain